jgi:hypothetical protein
VDASSSWRWRRSAAPLENTVGMIGLFGNAARGSRPPFNPQSGFGIPKVKSQGAA